jgi:hypothetical protein
LISKIAFSALLVVTSFQTSPAPDTSAKLSILLEAAKSPIVVSCSSDFETTAGETRESFAGGSKSGSVTANSSGPASIKVKLSFASDDEQANFKAKVKPGVQISSLTITEKTENSSGVPMTFSARVHGAKVTKVGFGKGNDHTGSLTFSCARMDYGSISETQ